MNNYLAYCYVCSLTNKTQECVDEEEYFEELDAMDDLDIVISDGH